ncbi:response regulator transcription factor [Campylobacter sp. faydin G-105]|uniref:response regulator transcription factor n=1 Tax=Campylobacter anatolicus TaxID=2829105 RepID=UPI001B9812FF|nr:response regulator transcription factor [Campylobacter anatolicus]MBR8462929.1 response regulator transcription factor [Campylobacter anatolicus]
MIKILLVEDDETLLEMIAEYLRDNDYLVTTCNNAADALDLAYEQNFDILVLDVKLPKGDGFSLLSSLRSAGVNTPAIFTTSLNTVNDLESGYESGCDDYLKKPYELKELLIRIKNLIKRSFLHTNSDFIALADGYKFYPQSKNLTKNDEIVNLSNKQSELLILFLQNKNKLLTKQEIFDKIWSFDEEPSEQSLRVYIKDIRQILGKENITNKRGDGYIYAIQN